MGKMWYVLIFVCKHSVTKYYYILIGARSCATNDGKISELFIYTVYK